MHSRVSILCECGVGAFLFAWRSPRPELLFGTTITPLIANKSAEGSLILSRLIPPPPRRYRMGTMANLFLICDIPQIHCRSASIDPLVFLSSIVTSTLSRSHLAHHFIVHIDIDTLFRSFPRLFAPHIPSSIDVGPILETYAVRYSEIHRYLMIDEEIASPSFKFPHFIFQAQVISTRVCFLSSFTCIIMPNDAVIPQLWRTRLTPPRSPVKSPLLTPALTQYPDSALHVACAYRIVLGLFNWTTPHVQDITTQNGRLQCHGLLLWNSCSSHLGQPE